MSFSEKFIEKNINCQLPIERMEFAAKYKWLVATAGLLVVCFLVWYFHIIVFYILTAAVLSLLGKPIVTLVERIKINKWTPPRWLAALIALLTLLFVILGLGWLLVPLIIEKIHFFALFDPAELNEIIQAPAVEFEQWVNKTFPLSNFSIKDVIMDKIAPLFNSGVLKNAVTGVTTFIVDSFIAMFSISFVTFFFLKEDKLFDEGVVTLFPKRYENNIRRAMSSSINLLVRYFIGILIESIIKFLVVGFSLYFLGMELSTALLIGMVTAVLNVIPYIGPLVGGVFAFIIAAMSPSIAGVTIGELIFEITVVLVVFQLIDNIILQPYIYSSSVKAHPLEIFIVILMAGYIAGVVGMLLAIPAYTVLRVFAKEFFANMRVVQKLPEKL